MYVNFISSAETIKYLQTGLEGTSFEMEGDAYKILPATGEWVKNSGNNIDYTMTCNGLYLGEATGATTALSYPGIPADIVIKANEFGKNNGYFVKHFNVGTIESETEVGSSLTSLRDEMLTKAVTASVADFDSVWDSYMDQYLALGGQDIIDERIQKLADVYGITIEK
jgi:putative aldouronate transport system substrate-binding protein